MKFEIPEHVAEAALLKTDTCRLEDALVVLIGAEERTCANDTCSKVFLLQEGRGTKHRTTGVMYCSNRCARAQAQRAYRHRLKKKGRGDECRA